MNEEGVSLAYVLHKKEPPKRFSSLHEKLEYLLPLNVANAKFRRDTQRIFTKIEDLITNTMIKPLLQMFRISTGTAGFRDGRACFLSLQEYYHGNQQKNVKLLAATAELQKIYWTNSASFTAENYTMRLLDCFNIIDEFGTPWADDAKNRQPHQSLYHESDSLLPVLRIESFKNNLLENIDTWTFQHSIDKFNLIAKMHVPKKKRNASSAGVSNAGSKSNKKARNKNKGNGN